MSPRDNTKSWLRCHCQGFLLDARVHADVPTRLLRLLSLHGVAPELVIPEQALTFFVTQRKLLLVIPEICLIRTEPKISRQKKLYR